jgi:hypothetical protein
VLDLLLAGVLGMSLVAVSTIAAARLGPRRRRGGERVPADVGPVLLVAAERHGTAFAATAAAVLVQAGSGGGAPPRAVAGA